MRCVEQGQFATAIVLRASVVGPLLLGVVALHFGGPAVDVPRRNGSHVSAMNARVCGYGLASRSCVGEPRFSVSSQSVPCIAGYRTGRLWSTIAAVQFVPVIFARMSTALLSRYYRQMTRVLLAECYDEATVRRVLVVQLVLRKRDLDCLREAHTGLLWVGDGVQWSCHLGT
mmetsp:Transcript_60952/g.163481  ORF Transcript_60952/g.163481 Transcript_60952/m.163481 type:complete len:172 (-) Transcript_60952:26-541(-)